MARRVPVMQRAVQEAITRAQTHGIVVVGVSDAWMSGPSGYYCEQVARAGLVCIHSASGQPLVAPPGGRAPALGTNPIAFGFPTQGEPLVIDLGTSAIAASEVELRSRIGEPLPIGVALDHDGNRTTDATAALNGALLPFGGHKGFALALAMHALGVICSTAERHGFVTGHVLIAFAPQLFLPLEDYQRLLSVQLEFVKEIPTVDPVAGIRIPSERALREGVHVDQAIYDGVRALGADYMTSSDEPRS